MRRAALVRALVRSRVVTYLEPERLALQIRELLLRRSTLRELLESRLADALTATERDDIVKVIVHLDREISDLQARLAQLLDPRP